MFLALFVELFLIDVYFKFYKIINVFTIHVKNNKILNNYFFNLYFMNKQELFLAEDLAYKINEEAKGIVDLIKCSFSEASQTIIDQINLKDNNNDAKKDLIVSESIEDFISKIYDTWNQKFKVNFKDIFTKDFVRKLEKFPHEDIRYFLEKVWLLQSYEKLEKFDSNNFSVEWIKERWKIKENIQNLAKLIELSFSWTWWEEYSVLIEALKPEEIWIMIKYDNEIFTKTRDVEINEDDYKNPLNWLELTNWEYELIKKEWDESILSLLKKMDDPISWKVKWYIFKNKIQISADSIYSYFSSIINSSNSDDWKEQSLLAIDLNLLAYASIDYSDIIFDCYEIFPEIAKMIQETLNKWYYKIDAESLYLDNAEKIKKYITDTNKSRTLKSENQDNFRIKAKLKEIGINWPYNEEDLDLGKSIIEDEVNLDEVFSEWIDLTEGVVIDN
jgi:hypothetical protein